MTPNPISQLKFRGECLGMDSRADCFDAAAFAAPFFQVICQGRDLSCFRGQDLLSLGVQYGFSAIDSLSNRVSCRRQGSEVVPVGITSEFVRCERKLGLVLVDVSSTLTARSTWCLAHHH